MKKNIAAVVLAFSGALSSAAESFPLPPEAVQSPDSTILMLTGASALEELDESEIERYEQLSAHPLDINSASRSKMLSSGLFSPYQIASLIDYQEHQGDILSYAELSRVDGFSSEFVKIIKGLILIDPSPGGRSSRKGKKDFDMLARMDANGTAGGKLKYSDANKYSVSATYRDELSANVAIYGKRHLGKVIIGDFAARFGQGMTLWSGFSLSGVPSISAFCKHATGISPSWTFSPESSLRGAAADFEFGSYSASAILTAAPGQEGGALNINRLGKNGEAGLTGLWNRKDGWKASADFRRNIDGNDFFGEFVFNGKDCSVSAVCGMIRNFSYSDKAAFKAGYDNGKANAAAGLQLKSHFLSIEDTYKMKEKSHTVKLLEQSKFQLSEFLNLGIRASEKFKSAEKPSFRHELRGDCCYSAGEWNANFRLDCAYCVKPAGLVYAEAGYKTENTAVWCRATTFIVDTWDDRIYCYERDVPGTFNVPAYYGRGFRLSLTGSLRIKHSRFDLRAAYLYSTRGVKMEAKIQYRLNL